MIAACAKEEPQSELGQTSQQPEQEDVPILEADVDKVHFPCEGGSFCIRIEGEDTYTIDTGADWVVCGELCGTESETVHVDVQKNPLTTPRSAIFSVKYQSGESRTITIEQEEAFHFRGKGTAESPFLISRAKELEVLSAYLASADSSLKYKSMHYKQTADIDMSSVLNHIPIGLSSEFAFTGTYDGDNHKITNLKVEQNFSGMPAGLFGVSGEGAVLRNIVIEGLSIRSSSYFTGAIVGDESGSVIENCIVTGAEIVDTGAPASGDNEDASLTGGIVGHAYDGTVKGCRFDGTIYASTNRAGGIIGVSDSSETGCVTVSDCEFSGNLSTGWIAGGIIGYCRGTVDIDGCTCRGIISATGNSVGGIVGRIRQGSIRNCVFSSAGSVKTAKADAGGIAGMVEGTGNLNTVIENNASYGLVSGLYNAGGIIGLISSLSGDKVTIAGCVAKGCEIYSTGGNNWKWQQAGGLCGYVSGSGGEVSFSNCLSHAYMVSGVLAKGGGIAGFVGYIDSANTSFTNCASCMSPSDILYNSSPAASSTILYYGGFFGRSTVATAFKECYAPAGIQFGPTNGSETRESCESISADKMTDGTLLTALKGSASVGSTNWIAGTDGYPAIGGIPTDPDRKEETPLRVSIIGDSISTFAGWVPNGYGCHYPQAKAGYDVNSVDKTWWHRLIYHYMPSARLDMNLSYSGTTVVKNSTDDSGKYYYERDFCARYIECSGMGRPDIICIHGGTNDCWQTPRNEYLLGTQSMLSAGRPSDEAMAAVYETADACTTLEQAKALDNSTFVQAYVKLIRMMQLQYPSVKIVCVIGDHVGTANHHAIQESVIHIAKHYESHCRVVDFPSLVGWQTTGAPLSKAGGSHPDAAGMDYMASEIYAQLGSWMTAR